VVVVVVAAKAAIPIPGLLNCKYQARAALSRRTIDGPCAVMKRPSGETPVCCLAARRATYGPYRPPLDGPFRPAKNGPSQMIRPDQHW